MGLIEARVRASLSRMSRVRRIFARAMLRDQRSDRLVRGRSGRCARTVIALVAVTALGAPSAVHAFPWSTDMFNGPAPQPLEIAPRVMPDGTLPIAGTNYNAHFGQPAGMPDEQPIPPMKLEAMTVRL